MTKNNCFIKLPKEQELRHKPMIATEPFGRTGHFSTRTIFGSACLAQATLEEADGVLELLLQYGINHIDTAPRYGEAELRIGPGMKNYRDRFFLATKIDQRRYPEARDQFFRSLERLQVNHVDLLQLHNLTDVPSREVIMGPGGALEFLVEAKDKKLTRYIGITGHGLQAPRMHLQTLKRFKEFDSVLLPYNYLLMQNPDYATEVDQVLSYCKIQKIAVQTIKSVARRFWGDKPRSYNTWYEPLIEGEAIQKCVHWVLGWPDLFLITPGDFRLLRMVLEAAARIGMPPSDKDMSDLVKTQGMETVFV
jgi:aryl-alcohol dehydrogenase-like predicted oxidoreductase